ncbi:hypothetical protein BDN70DRAFT_555649 [Pholiota conissans]|uniref:Uncharacterized protein n=1 Tax=Pholiota conissans TaxID=109636 RepID=A0A9P5YPJ7_9AGAR|nr:hypothetical protein BDN70DRAFT_555649 [Pholiota conissans]
MNPLIASLGSESFRSHYVAFLRRVSTPSHPRSPSTTHATLPFRLSSPLVLLLPAHPISAHDGTKSTPIVCCNGPGELAPRSRAPFPSPSKATQRHPLHPPIAMLYHFSATPASPTRTTLRSRFSYLQNNHVWRRVAFRFALQLTTELGRTRATKTNNIDMPQCSSYAVRLILVLHARPQHACNAVHAIIYTLQCLTPAPFPLCKCDYPQMV